MTHDHEPGDGLDHTPRVVTTTSGTTGVVPGWLGDVLAAAGMTDEPRHDCPDCDAPLAIHEVHLGNGYVTLQDYCPACGWRDPAGPELEHVDA